MIEKQEGEWVPKTSSGLRTDVGPVTKRKEMGHPHAMITTQGSLLVIGVVRSRDLWSL